MATINQITNAFRRWLGGRQVRSGQAYTEYGMIVVVIGIALIASLTFMGNTVHGLFSNVSVSFPH